MQFLREWKQHNILIMQVIFADSEHVNIILDNMFLGFVATYTPCRDRCFEILWSSTYERVISQSRVLQLLCPVVVSLCSLPLPPYILNLFLGTLYLLAFVAFHAQNALAAGAGRDCDWEKFNLSRMLWGDWPKEFSLWDCMETDPCTFLEGGR